MPSITFRASPNGMSVGLVSATSAQRVATVAVVPKVWRGSPKAEHVIVECDADQTTISISAFEGDWVTVSGPSDAIDLVGTALDRAAQGEAESEHSLGPLLQRVL